MISGMTWSMALYSSLSGQGFNGANLMDFCDAVGNGSALHVVGKTFATVDSGPPGGGTGSGSGITGIPEPVVAASIFSTATGAFGQSGAALQDFCDAVAQALVSQMATATLNSSHSVSGGTGTIVPGSITVVGPLWGLAIAAAAPGFAGSQWSNFANAIGVGCANGMNVAGGTVTISAGGGGSGGVIT